MSCKFQIREFIAGGMVCFLGTQFKSKRYGCPMFPNQPKILQQMGITPDAWLEHSEQFMEHYANVSGRWSRMCAFKQRIGGHWCKGKSASHQLHPN